MGEDLSVVQRDDYEAANGDFESYDDWEIAKQECVVAPKYLEIDGELFIRKD